MAILRSVLTGYARAETAHEKSVEEYKRVKKKESDTTESMWADYWDRQSDRRRKESLLETYDRYLVMTEGNEEIAKKFLAKAYDSKLIEAAGLGGEATDDAGIQAPTLAEQEFTEECPF